MSGKGNFQVEGTTKKPKLEILSSNERDIMDKSQSLMKSFISNPGFEHIGFNILNHFNKATLLSLRYDFT